MVIAGGAKDGAAVLERGGAPLPVAIVSHDTRLEPDKARWTDWLHVGNLLQYLDENAMITTTRTYSSTNVTAVGPAPAAPTPSGNADLLADIFDASAKALAEHAIDAGWPAVEVAFPAGDKDDTPIEVAWPVCKVGILPSGVARPKTLIDWDLRTPSEWTAESLIVALEQGAN